MGVINPAQLVQALTFFRTCSEPTSLNEEFAQEAPIFKDSVTFGTEHGGQILAAGKVQFQPVSLDNSKQNGKTDAH